MNHNDIVLGKPEEFNVLIEIPKGTGNKYEINEQTGYLQLDFVYRDNLLCPFNYGYIPHTLAEDKDPLDVMVFSTFPIMPYVVAKVKPFGILRLKDRGEQDNKIFAVPVKDPLAEKFNDIGDITEQQKTEIIDFWNEIAKQKKKIVEIEGFFGKDRAIEEVQKYSL